jgi:hypothetical protein
MTKSRFTDEQTAAILRDTVFASVSQDVEGGAPVEVPVLNIPGTYMLGSRIAL